MKMVTRSKLWLPIARIRVGIFIFNGALYGIGLIQRLPYSPLVMRNSKVLARVIGAFRVTL